MTDTKIHSASEALAEHPPQDATCYPLPDGYMATLEQLRPSGRCRCTTCQALRRILRLQFRVHP